LALVPSSFGSQNQASGCPASRPSSLCARWSKRLDAAHRQQVRCGGERAALRQRRADPLRRRVVGDEFGVCGLERAQLDEQRVVLGVAQVAVAAVVVLVVGGADRRAQLLDVLSNAHGSSCHGRS
jgi:hypothetical protein